jgi:sigma-B regulation protein RsbU (phosphoserine phosphatase)
MFCTEQFKVRQIHLLPSETMVLVTDGVTETENPRGEDYGVDRLVSAFQQRRALPLQEVIAGCLREVSDFGGRVRQSDDVTVLAIRRR